MVADSGYRPGPDGKPVYQATSKPRFVKRMGFDSTVHIYPPADLVKQWLKETNYYSWNIWLSIACFLAVVAIVVFVAPSQTWKKGAGIAVMTAAALFAVGGMQSLTRKPFDYARENEKWLWADDYRAELKKDSTLHSYWNKKWERNEISFATNKKAK